MTRKIIIHAGWPKTGTSSVQNALFDGRKALLIEEGVLYPSIANLQSRMLVTMFRESAANQPMNKVQGVSSTAQLSKLAQDYKTAYETEIQEADWNTLILSAEGLANFTLEELRKFKIWINTFSQDQTVYLLVREPAKFMTSVIQQYLKTGHVLDVMYEHLPPNIMPDYKNRISNFITVFGHENIKVDSFENAIQHASGLMGYFAKKWDIGENQSANLVAQARHDNASLTMFSAQILSSINRQRPMFDGNGKGVNRTLAELNFLKMYAQGGKFKLPKDVVKRIYDKVEPEMNWLQQKYGISYKSVEPQTVPDKDQFVSPTKQQQDFIDATAIMISDLLNERHYLRFKQRAQRLRSDGQHKQAQNIMEDARRIFTPDIY